MTGFPSLLASSPQVQRKRECQRSPSLSRTSPALAIIAAHHLTHHPANSHAGGHRFESCRAHHSKRVDRSPTSSLQDLFDLSPKKLGIDPGAFCDKMTLIEIVIIAEIDDGVQIRSD